MSFSSPLWLLGLLPWIAVVIWILTGRAEQTTVPFLHLWRGPQSLPRARQSLRPPPLEIVLILIAMLLAILASGRPNLNFTRVTRRQPTTMNVVTQNVWIVSVSARSSPSPEIMIRVHNDSDLDHAQIKIGSTFKNIELPKRGNEKNYFIEVDQLAAKTNVDLLDKHAELIKSKSWPAVHADSQLSDDVQRMIQTYSKLRPPDDASIHVEVTNTEPLSNQAAVIVANDPSVSLHGELHVADHPIVADVDWTKAIKSAITAKPQANWTPLVSVGDQVLVAIRESPARQVWIGFDSPNFARRGDFVVFWSNVLNWTGHGGEEFVATLPTSAPISPAIDVSPHSERSGIEISAPLLIGAVALILIASLVLPLAKAARPVNILHN
ncbi:MAG TPA: hypothetical protein VKK61_00080 [Tepidisphaeraceae bacterium]|nr:hypothetical protein [Tepidisphaeraceae bacterium]